MAYNQNHWYLFGQGGLVESGRVGEEGEGAEIDVCSKLFSNLNIK